MRHPGSEFGYLAPARDFGRTASIVLVAGAVGATAAAGAVFALLGGPGVELFAGNARSDALRRVNGDARRGAISGKADNPSFPPADADGKSERPIDLTRAAVAVRRQWSARS